MDNKIKVDFTDPGLNDGLSDSSIDKAIDRTIDNLSPADRLLILLMGGLKSSFDILNRKVDLIIRKVDNIEKP